MTEIQTHLRKLEFLQSELLHNVVTEHVSSSEEPASSTTFLVCDGARLEINDIVEDMLVSNSCRARGQCRPNIRMRQDGSSELDLGVACCSSLPRGYMIQCQLATARESMVTRSADRDISSSLSSLDVFSSNSPEVGFVGTGIAEDGVLPMMMVDEKQVLARV